MSQNCFRPVNKAHAIVEQLIFFEFTPTLEQAMPALITLKDELHADFPASEILNTMRVEFHQQGAGRPEVGTPEIKEAAGLRLSRLQDNGSPDTMINVDLNNIGIFCHSYTSWNEVWPKQQNYIRKIFAKFGKSPSFMTGVGMKWLDQFLYEGDETQYDAHQLLNAGSGCLHPRAFTSGTRWHCHTGWFDLEIAKGREVLNQLNVDAGVVNIHGSLRTAVTIDHTQVVRVNHSPDELAAYGPGAPSLDALSGLMEVLHNGNKRILADVLTESSLKMIGMGPEQAE